jgi:putative transposase
MGGKKLHVLLADFMTEHQIKMGRDALFDLLADHYLLVRRKRRKVQTTDSGHWYKRYPNLIAQLHVDSVNQIWVSDITYLKIRQGFLYLSLITDVCSRKIVGYNLADNLESVNAENALKMAINRTIAEGGILQGLIHHSDQGFQYCSAGYTGLLQQHAIAISMSDRGQPLQNSIAERVNGILKQEYLEPLGLIDKHQVMDQVPQIIETYNNQRPHMSCGMLTPSKAHQIAKPLNRQWKNKYRKKEVEILAVN